jgi:hypothetical protein
VPHQLGDSGIEQRLSAAQQKCGMERFDVVDEFLPRLYRQVLPIHFQLGRIEITVRAALATHFAFQIAGVRDLDPDMIGQKGFLTLRLEHLESIPRANIGVAILLMPLFPKAAPHADAAVLRHLRLLAVDTLEAIMGNPEAAPMRIAVCHRSSPLGSAVIRTDYNRNFPDELAPTTTASLRDDAIMFSDIPQTLFRLDKGALRTGEKSAQNNCRKLDFPLFP